MVMSFVYCLCTHIVQELPWSSMPSRQLTEYLSCALFTETLVSDSPLYGINVLNCCILLINWNDFLLNQKSWMKCKLLQAFPSNRREGSNFVFSLLEYTQGGLICPGWYQVWHMLIIFTCIPFTNEVAANRICLNFDSQFRNYISICCSTLLWTFLDWLQFFITYEKLKNVF